MLILRARVAICTLVLSISFAGPLNAAPATPALVSNGGNLHSFSDAVNLPLATDDDFGRFVDPQIVGSDRQKALFFLKLMPANKRGDFVYVSSSGSILSNRASFARGIKFRSTSSVTLPHTAPKQTNESRVGLVRPLSYPPTTGTGGAFIRTYSQQGENALYGYAVAPCDVNLPGSPGSGDSGNMYFNAYDSNGNDVIDAGLGANNTSQVAFGTSGPQQTLTVFTNPANPAGSGWVNQNQLFACVVAVGIMFGSLPSPNQQYSMIAVGITPYDPAQFTLPPSTTTWSNAAWNFYDTPAALTIGSGTWNGIPSNCSGCSVARMTTIAQRVGFTYDGSCFGYCSGGADAYWYETVGGELVPTCQNSGSSFSCTIEYQSSGSWSGGTVEYPSNGYAIGFSATNDQYAATGINLSPLYNTSQSLRSLPASLPQAPTTVCSPDSAGYCAVLVSQVQTGSCNTGSVNPRGVPIIEYTYSAVYDVFKFQSLRELQETATENGHFGAAHCLPLSYSWAPNNPATQYGDSNLP
jgi:hypothetical protein